MTKKMGRPPKREEEKFVAKNIRFPRPLWDAFAALVPEGQRSGVVQRLVEREVQRQEQEREQEAVERAARVDAGHGSLAWLPTTVDDLLQWKREDVEHETQEWETRLRGREEATG